MDCLKCKKSIPEDAIFCPHCGKKQVRAPRRTPRTRPNGTGTVYRRGKTWMACYTHGYTLDSSGSRKAVRSTKGGFRTKKEALEYLPLLAAAPKKKVPNLSQLYETYTSGKKFQKLSQSRQEKYTIAWKKIEPLWFWKIDLITTFDLQNIVDSAADTYYTARDIKDLFSKLYRTALPDDFVSKNLAEYIELPPLNAKEQQPFRKEEIQALWADYSAGNWWTGYILLMIYTGMMPGELLDAQKSNIDWESKQIIGAGKKTEKRRKTPIVLADFLLPILSDLCEHTPGDKLIRISKDKFYSTYYDALSRAGTRRLTPYSCRHTAATTLALENIPPAIIQQIMRHSKFSTTEKYIHVDTSSMHQAVNALHDVPSKE